MLREKVPLALAQVSMYECNDMHVYVCSLDLANVFVSVRAKYVCLCTNTYTHMHTFTRKHALCT